MDSEKFSCSVTFPGNSMGDRVQQQAAAYGRRGGLKPAVVLVMVGVKVAACLEGPTDQLAGPLPH